MTNKDENLVKVPATRVRRGSLKEQGKLVVQGKDPNFHYRVVNDIHGRVPSLMDQGYVPETSEDVRVGDSRVDNTAKLGRVREIPVGLGDKAILMKQRMDWYLEDQQDKADALKESEKAMRPNPNEGTYGKVDVTRK